MSEIVIAIDGPAGSGKSTTASQVADRLGLVYLDTGAMYRAVTLKAIREGIDLNDGSRLAEMAQRTKLRFENVAGSQKVLLDGEDVTQLIRRPDVTAGTTPVSSCPQVRKILVARQREIAASGGVVAEGRDTTSVVFPEADLKIYLSASLRKRAERRVRDLERAGSKTSSSEQSELLSRRDNADSTRDASPLTRVPGAYEIDTSHITIEEQVQRIIDLAREVVAV